MTTPPFPKWTPEQDKELQRLVALALSTTQIAERMKPLGIVSRNAIIGRCRRMGYKLLYPSGGRGGRPPKATVHAVVRAQPKPAKPRPSPKPAPRPMPKPAKRHEGSVPFIERSHDGCAFPLWGSDCKTGNVCNQPVKPGSAWCEHHFIRCRTLTRAPARIRIWR